jgi:hypothetical protein
VLQELSPGLSGQIDEVMKRKPLDVKKALLKALSAVATLGSGCSLGPEVRPCSTVAPLPDASPILEGLTEGWTLGWQH